MDGFEFTSKLVEHLAWPAVVVYLLLSQKSAVGDLIDRIKKLKVGSAEAEIAERAKDLKVKADVLEAKPIEPPDPEMVRPANAPLSAAVAVAPAKFQVDMSGFVASDRDERLRASGLIIEQWARLEQSIRYLVSRHDPVGTSPISVTDAIARLKIFGVLSNETVSLVKDLRKLRNDVAHSRLEPTRTAAENFAESCAKVNERIANEEFAWQQAAIRIGEEMQRESAVKK